MTQKASGRVRRNRRALLVLIVVGGLSALLAFLLPGTGARDAPRRDAWKEGITDKLARRLPPEHPRITFQDVASEVGIDVRHGVAKRGSVLPEDMGSGAALEDLDGDGDLDLFLVGFSGNVQPGRAEDAEPAEGAGTHRLFRNDGGRFIDVTADSGLAPAGHGMGVASGDVDGDGRLDLYVTAYGANRLFRNLGGLRFEDITARAGVGDHGFGAGAAFGDVDRDGDLDLYLCNYVDFRWDGRPPAASEWGGYTLPFTLNPSSFDPAPNRYYRNRGDGTFEEVAAALGIEDAEGRSLGCTFADFNEDGWPDLYVLNDVSKNAYFENQGDGTFKDRSLDSLSADYRGAMGNAVTDLDHDGDLDLFITHWIAQENGVYVNLLREQGAKKRLIFTDQADYWGLGASALNFVGWGTAFVDYDLDGTSDLVVINGSTMPRDDDATRLVAQRPQLFWHQPQRRYFELGAAAGAPFEATWSGRGLVDGDLDGDGDVDLVVTENNGPVHVLRNGAPKGRWLTVALRQPTGNRFAVGARLEVTAGGRTQTREVGAGTSYLCHRPLTLHVGLGDAETADLAVRWPDGTVTERKGVAAGTRVELSRAD